MSFFGHAVTLTIKGLLRLLCRFRMEGLETIPPHGPLIVVVNHINFLDVPLLYTSLYPRQTSSLVKAETWDNFLLGKLGNLWNGIPLQRDSTDFSALRSAEQRLRDGHILMVAPEGTRSYDGQLGRGKTGVVALALRAGVPILPVLHFGGENFWANLKRLRRTPVTLRVGEPFRIEPPAGRVNAELRQKIVDEMMENMAALLPPSYRGAYAGRAEREYSYLRMMSFAD